MKRMHAQVYRYDHKGNEHMGEVVTVDQIPDVLLVGIPEWADMENDQVRHAINEDLTLGGRYWLHPRMMLRATGDPLTPGGWDDSMGGTR